MIFKNQKSESKIGQLEFIDKNIKNFDSFFL